MEVRKPSPRSTTLQGSTKATVGSSSSPTGQRRVARAKDLERRPAHAELRLEGGGDIDLGGDAEALGSQRLAHGILGAVDRLVDNRIEGTLRVTDQASFMNIFWTTSNG
jgi:hypothetical protein